MLWQSFLRQIDANTDDSVLFLQLHPCLPTTLAAQISCKPDVRGPTTRRQYRNPSFEQYAAITGKWKSLRILLETTRAHDSPPFRDVFSPPSCATPYDLLSLAVIEDQIEIVTELVKYIDDRFPGDLISFVNQKAPSGETPLSLAVQFARWQIIPILIRRGADSLHRPGNDPCPFMAALTSNPAEAEKILEASRDATSGNCPILNAMKTRRWSEYGPDDGDQRSIREVVSENTGAIALVHKFCPQETSVVDVGRKEEEGSVPEAEHTCEAEGCNVQSVGRCSRCGNWCCQRHLAQNEHECNGG